MMARCLATLRFIDETKFIQDNRTEIVKLVRWKTYCSDYEGCMTDAAVDMAIMLQLQGRYMGDAAEIANRLAFIASYSALAGIAYDLVFDHEAEFNKVRSAFDAAECDDDDEELEEDVVEDQTDSTTESGERGVSTPS